MSFNETRERISNYEERPVLSKKKKTKQKRIATIRRTNEKEETLKEDCIVKLLRTTVPSNVWKAQLCKRDERGTKRTWNERTLNVGEITNHVVAHSKRRTFDRIEPPRCQPKSCSLPLRRVHRFGEKARPTGPRTVIEIREFLLQIPSYDWHVPRAKRSVHEMVQRSWDRRPFGIATHSSHQRDRTVVVVVVVVVVVGRSVRRSEAS